MDQRIVSATEAVEFSDESATSRTFVESDDSAVFVWGVKPGQEVSPHVHPDGQDTWVMLRGTLTYYLGDGRTKTIEPGDVDVAPQEVVHGGVNEDDENVVFVSIHSAPDIGYEAAKR